ncbi:unnamed protein product [Lupinus luteus]|uniref:Uncharacterized protein n=1 Tax=Lupinus luteus TaxID=3873 RepID=A0AAV1VQ98_LUPLU
MAMALSPSITMEGSSGVRKGAWSKEEDDLLRACVQQYGEGKWHLVPQRAGLNRCRKSCRLRWSLIAGRLPGRTSNDVKNYWNTYIRKKLSSQNEDINARHMELVMESDVVIKPQPRKISTKMPFLMYCEDQSPDKECISNEACLATTSECNEINDTCSLGLRAGLASSHSPDVGNHQDDF